MTIKVENVFVDTRQQIVLMSFPISLMFYIQEDGLWHKLTLRPSICLIISFGEETNLKITQRTLSNNSSALVVFLCQYLCQVKVPKNQHTKARSQPLCISNDRTFDQPLHDQVCEIKISLVGVDGSTNIQKQHIKGG